MADFPTNSKENRQESPRGGVYPEKAMDGQNPWRGQAQGGDPKNAADETQLERDSGAFAKSLFWRALKDYSRPLAIAVLALAATDFLDVLPPLIIKFAIDGIEGGKGVENLLWAGAFFVTAALLQACCRFIWRKFFLGTSHVIGYDLRQRLFEHLQTLPFRFFATAKTGDLMSRLTNDVDEVRQMYGLGALLAMDSLFYFCTVPFILIWMSPKLALYILIPMPLIPFFVMRIGSKLHRLSKRVQERTADLSSRVQENVSGIRVIKTFVREQSEIVSVEVASDKLLQENLDLARVEAGFHPALEFVMGLGVFILIWLGGLAVVNGELSLGAIVAFQSYLLKLVWPMTALGMTINLYQRGMASLGRCAEILCLKSDLTEAGTSGNDMPIHGGFSVKNLTFAYPGNTKPLFANLSFEIPVGSSLALVGPIGSGKTTLIHLLLRLFDPPVGSIFLDGKDIRDFPIQRLREAFGYVPQDSFLFSETVLENVAFGLKDRSDLEKASACLKMAGIHEEVNALPDKLQTLLGERGVNLSGGQKQRLTLARALARDPLILVLDDSMSAVDTETEERISRELKQVLQGRTGIVVSHRLSSIQAADQIIYLDEGTIQERGTHQELLALKGNYFRLWEKQKMKSEWEIE